MDRGCASWGYGIRVTTPEDKRPLKKIAHWVLVKIYG
jgi:hypothetical protein